MTCSKCRRPKVADDFYDGKRECKDCIRAKRSAHRATWVRDRAAYLASPEHRQHARLGARAANAKRWAGHEPKPREERLARKRQLAMAARRAKGVAPRSVGRRLTPQQNRQRVREWAAQNPARRRERKRLDQAVRRARKLGQFVESVDPQRVFERDEGICGICGGEVDREDFHVDHMVPLAKGGKHSYANVQLAHPACNLRKGARVVVPF
jgi:5-methylcytosine-specific restriction endonuclease McrA